MDSELASILFGGSCVKANAAFHVNRPSDFSTRLAADASSLGWMARPSVVVVVVIIMQVLCHAATELLRYSSVMLLFYFMFCVVLYCYAIPLLPCYVM